MGIHLRPPLGSVAEMPLSLSYGVWRELVSISRHSPTSAIISLKVILIKQLGLVFCRTWGQVDENWPIRPQLHTGGASLLRRADGSCDIGLSETGSVRLIADHRTPGAGGTGAIGGCTRYSQSGPLTRSRDERASLVERCFKDVL
jgi:hypothetical protein